MRSTSLPVVSVGISKSTTACSRPPILPQEIRTNTQNREYTQNATRAKERRNQARSRVHAEPARLVYTSALALHSPRQTPAARARRRAEIARRVSAATQMASPDCALVPRRVRAVVAVARAGQVAPLDPRLTPCSPLRTRRAGLATRWHLLSACLPPLALCVVIYAGGGGASAALPCPVALHAARGDVRVLVITHCRRERIGMRLRQSRAKSGGGAGPSGWHDNR